MALTPREDFYYLSLAQFYLSGADAIVQGAEQAALQAIQTQDPQAKLQFERQRDELGQQADALFRSTQLAILRARDLNPLNTDHYRNMSALYLGWFQATQQPAKLARSITYGEQAISMTPNNADLHNRLAQNYLIAANFPATVQEMVLQQAQDWLGNWEKYHRTSGGRTGDTRLPLVARYRQEAATLLAEGKLKEGMYILAAAELQYSLFLDERYDETYLQLGDLYWQRELYEEAALMYGAGIRLQPALLSRTSVPFTVWANQHRGLAEGKSPVEVRLIEIVRAGKSEPVARAYQAIADRTETALKDPKLRPAQQNSLHQQAFDAYQVLGYIQILRWDRPAAIRFLETALSHRQAIEVLKNLTLLYSQTGQFDLALARAQAALQFAQEKGLATDVQALQGLILQLQQLQQQIQQAEARVASAPGDYQAHLDLANLYGQAGRLAEALAEAEAALQLAPAEKRVEVQALVDSLRQLQEGTP
jgi:tetratricopeptide (TPR) repeat protein